ncbi:MAG: hypothetical protein AAGF75_04805, partial [Cyanobacteria bacterium P01_H01_bin.130]
PENKELTSHEKLIDAEPREVFIIACLLLPIIGIGFYPKSLTDIYDSTTQQLTARLRASVPTLVVDRPRTGTLAESLQGATAAIAPELPPITITR